MKKVFFLLLFISASLYSQSNFEIANVYLVKTEEQLNKKDLDQAIRYFEKVKTLLGEKTTVKVEEMGVFLYFQLKDYEKAKNHAKSYFSKVSDKEKETERYQEVLFLYVEIEELIEKQNQIDLANAKKRLLAEKEEKRLDSLKEVWKDKALSLAIQADTILSFDKEGVAVFMNGGKYGILDDSGNQLVAANYSETRKFDLYTVMLEGVKGKPTRIEVFNSRTKEKKTLPPVSEFNALSTHYGVVMQPRYNNILICYPNNSNRVAVYDLITNTAKPSLNLSRFFEYWKKLKVIRKFNKKNQIKINKNYYNFGGNLNGFLAFYNATSELYGFISVEGKIIKPTQYSNVGTFCNGFAEAVKPNGERVWINEQVQEIRPLLDKSGLYEGTTTINKVGDFLYQFKNADNQIIKGEELLEEMETFIKENK